MPTLRLTRSSCFPASLVLDEVWSQLGSQSLLLRSVHSCFPHRLVCTCCLHHLLDHSAVAYVPSAHHTFGLFFEPDASWDSLPWLLCAACILSGSKPLAFHGPRLSSLLLFSCHLLASGLLLYTHGSADLSLPTSTPLAIYPCQFFWGLPSGQRWYHTGLAGCVTWVNLLTVSLPVPLNFIFLCGGLLRCLLPLTSPSIGSQRPLPEEASVPC